MLRDAIDGKYAWRFDGSVQVNGRTGLSARVGNSPDELVRQIVVDPARGYTLLMQREDDPKTGRAIHEAYAIDVRRHQDDRWFPMRSVVVRRRTAEGPFLAEIYTVQELQVNPTLSPDDFAMQMPPKTRVSVPGEPYVMDIPKKMRIRADDLDQLYEQVKSFTRIREGGGGQKSNLLVLVAVWTVIALGLLGVVFLIRKRAAVRSP
jgi:hypothetical protein